jgi:hypothetical protein
MNFPENIFLIQQDDEITWATSRPTSPTISDDQVREYGLIEEPKVDANIVSMSTNKGSLDLQLEGGACGMLAASFAQQFKDRNGTNYAELSFFHEDTGPMTVTMQRAVGMTPGMKAAKMKELIQAGDIEGAMAL